MNLRETILEEHSRNQKNKIVAWIGPSQERFDALFALFLHDEYRVVQRAAWPLSDAVIAHPHFIEKHFFTLLQKLKEPDLHDAVKRNALRLMENLTIPPACEGEIMNCCFEYISSSQEKVAVKAAALSVLGNLAKIYPDIKSELKTTIEAVWDRETAAFHSRAKKVLRALGF